MGFGKKTGLVLAAVVGMGFFLSFLIMLDLGTDPCTFMSLHVSADLRAAGLSIFTFGTWNLIMNLFLFVIVVVFDRKLIGLGTIFNMVLIGYIADFCDWIWRRTIPSAYFTALPMRGILFAVALAGFIITAAIYMNAAMGVAPYDAMPIIIAAHVKKIPSSLIRILYDMSVIAIGFIAGGVPGICTILMAFFLGPAISLVGKLMKKTVAPRAPKTERSAVGVTAG